MAPSAGQLEGFGLPNWTTSSFPSKVKSEVKIHFHVPLGSLVGVCCIPNTHTHTHTQSACTHKIFQEQKLIFRNSRINIHFSICNIIRAASSQEGDGFQWNFYTEQCQFPLFILRLYPETYHCIRNGIHSITIYLSMDTLRTHKEPEKALVFMGFFFPFTT